MNFSNFHVLPVIKYNYNYGLEDFASAVNNDAGYIVEDVLPDGGSGYERDYYGLVGDIDSTLVVDDRRGFYIRDSGTAESFAKWYLGWQCNQHLKIKLRLPLNYLDIEVGSENGFPDIETANEEVTAITVKIDRKCYVFGRGEFVHDRENVFYFRFDSERALLQKFFEIWDKESPDIVTGWNIETFDIPYLINRAKRLFDDKKNPYRLLSPWKRVREYKMFGMGGRELQAYEIMGVETLDYLQMYRKFTYTNQESYRLDHIAFVELGERKLDYSEQGSLHLLYKNDYQKFIEYNIKDVELVEELESKLKLLEMLVALAYLCKVNYGNTFGQVRMWDTLIFNNLLSKKIVIPPKKHANKSSNFEGAFVKEPIIGIHEWVVNFDLNSLYPHLIMQYNLSPETLITDELPKELQKIKDDRPGVTGLLDQSQSLDGLEKYNLTYTPNNEFYRKDVQGFLPEMMQQIYNDRVKYKKKMIATKKKLQKEKDPKERAVLSKLISQYHNMQNNLKTTLNSAFGAMGNEHFRYFDQRIAEAVTTSGQLSIKWIEKEINRYLNEILKPEEEKDYVVAVDTDSVYICMDDLVKTVYGDTIDDKNKVVDFLDKVCSEQMEKIIDKSYQKLAEYVNAYDQKMVMKRENIADRALWTAKKRYIMNVYDAEGIRYEEPQLKIMGIEAIRSSTPAACKDKMKHIFKIIMNGTEEDAINYIDEFREEFRTLKAEDIFFPRSVRGITKYYDAAQLYIKGSPIHVKGALIYNKLLKDKKLLNAYPTIKDGEKIKFAYLKKPNPVGDTVIAILNQLPEEFGLEEYIDYDLQFQKAFIEPMSSVMGAVGWQTEHISTLEDFFG
ncbi:DNA polymerase [Marine Group I thaumarchaeote]|uniref:DNA polymerase n=1 Tax=Marine Group I thaumarchaeote TaxID=2511932 RepID=A0A7K4MXD1_9ARCH|nr:DNA polymerase [Marine Group I thaumarchaeote]